MGYPYSKGCDPGMRKNTLYADKLGRILAFQPAHRPASKSHVRLAHSQSIYAQLNTPVSLLSKHSSINPPNDAMRLSTSDGTGAFGRKPSMLTGTND